MQFHIVTLFKESIESYLGISVLGRAQKRGLVKILFYNPRDYVNDKYKRVDDKVYGGGPGMVMQAEPILKAVEAALSRAKVKSQKSKVKIIILSPSGKQFTNTYAETLRKKYSDIIIISGRYEGIDARVKKILNNYKQETTNYKLISISEISVGPYTLTGGEVPAMVVIDAVARRVRGVLGKNDSIEERRIAGGEVYTRPEVLEYKRKKYRVPKVLLSGNHKKIEKWRKTKEK